MHAMKVVIQKKTQSYAEHTSRNDFIPLATKIFDFHSHFNSFFTSYAHTIITHD